PRTPALELRLAHLSAKLGDNPQAFRTIEELSNDAQAGPSAERIAALTLYQKGKTDLAIQRIETARKKYEASPELAELAAALSLQLGRAAEAEKLLDEFLTQHPDNEELALMRAKILAESLERSEEARALLARICQTSQSSAPWVLTAHLELARK